MNSQDRELLFFYIHVCIAFGAPVQVASSESSGLGILFYVGDWYSTLFSLIY